ncbi:hypothetical protein LOK49_LG05G02896 [Camellia lanceoleosa]|uniref:Uncharacterized protein n=1 Tax=Camellia lanceoleosa TaxID=1840588 RepID=A0ACC0HNR2_9ERIC|nr:hypothetical protein LOK49_LG05G02896 [Camellia lanceoleosa]
MQKGAEAVHAINLYVLVILSGLIFDKDLSFLIEHPVSLSFTGKLVFEVHWYGFSDGLPWKRGNPNHVCGRAMHQFMRKAGFVLEQGYPLFLSEFGVDLRGTDVIDNRYLNCFLGMAAELDFDWALWTLAGSYYLKEGVSGFDEVYGLFNWNWFEARNSSFLDKISGIQLPFQDQYNNQSNQSQTTQSNIPPTSGQCLQRKSPLEPLNLDPCRLEAWIYNTQQKIITIKGTYLCLQADGLNKPVKLGVICSGSTSKWEPISDSNMHLSSKLAHHGAHVRLDVDPNSNTIVMNTCKCLKIRHKCDPASQWFKIVNSTRSLNVTTPIP